MIEIVITKNDANQRFDRFLRKYFENAPLSVIQKNIRKKNFKINDKQVLRFYCYLNLILDILLSAQRFLE